MNVLQWMVQMTGKREEVARMFKTKIQNRYYKRNFGEIASEQDFFLKCVAFNKTCAIGLLDARNINKQDKEEFGKQLEVMKSLNREDTIDLSNGNEVHYAWINVTCYPEWLKFFGKVDHKTLPQLVNYYPRFDQYLVNGSDDFTVESARRRINQFLLGGLQVEKTGEKLEDMRFAERDCSLDKK